MTEQDEQQSRSLPTSDLDLNLMITDSVWGRPDVSKELKDTLRKYYIEKDSLGNDTITDSSLWGLLSYYTRDIRLGNLAEFNGELKACRIHLKVAGYYLMSGMIEPFIVRLSKAIAIIETSQSKHGFLRKAMNTLRNEHINQQIEAPKKGFFGGKQEQGGNY